MPAVFQYPHTVTSEEIDGLGHAGNVVYVGWMQDAAFAHSTAQGWPPERYIESGVGWVVRSHQVEYLQPAWEGERVIVQTWVADFQKISSRRRYRIFRNDEEGETVLATAETNWVYIGLERRIPRRIPPELSGAFVVVDPEEEPGG